MSASTVVKLASQSADKKRSSEQNRRMLVTSIDQGVAAAAHVFRSHALSPASLNSLLSLTHQKEGGMARDRMKLLRHVCSASLEASVQCRDQLRVSSLAPLQHVTDLVPYVLRACKKMNGGLKADHRQMSELEAERELLDEFEVWLNDELFEVRRRCNEDEVDASTIPFVDLWSVAESFVRQRRGVPTDSGTFVVRPRHSTYCPQSHPTQASHVEFLRWMQQRSPADPRVLVALDVACGSGMMTDVLLRARVPRVVSVDCSASAVASTRGLADDHFAAKRSHREQHDQTSAGSDRRRSGARSVVLKCPLTPLFDGGEAKRSAGDRVSEIVTDHRGKYRAVDVCEGAARRRRQQCRLSRVRDTEAGEAGAYDLLSSRQLDAEVLRGCRQPDLVCFHPPTPYLEASSFFPHPLSLAMHQASAYYHAEDVLAQFVSSFDNHLADCRYVGLVMPGGSLPFSPAGYGASVGGMLDRVEGRLVEGGLFDVVHRRRFVNGPQAAVAMADEALKAPFVFQLVSCLAYGDDVGVRALRDALRKDLVEWFSAASVETVVLQRRDGTKAGGGGGGGGKRKANSSSCDTAAESSFEHDNYLPTKSLATTPMPDHWSMAGPSYSYLLDEFIDDGSSADGNLSTSSRSTPKKHILPYFASDSERKAVAVSLSDGSQSSASSPFALPQHSPLAQFDHNAQAAFSAAFSQEIKAQRRGKMRKMAMEPTSKRDWYLDEKVLKSHASQVSLLNELSRLSVPEPD